MMEELFLIVQIPGYVWRRSSDLPKAELDGYSILRSGPNHVGAKAVVIECRVVRKDLPGPLARVCRALVSC
jgi:hypothetical protein